MATSYNTLSPFLRQVMAPLPAEAEQVADKRYLRVIRDDLQATWHRGMARVHLATAERDVAWGRYKVAGVGTYHPLYEAYREAMDAHLDEIRRHLLVPAPGKAELKWKRDRLRGVHSSFRPQAEAAIARDEARLSVS